MRSGNWHASGEFNLAILVISFILVRVSVIVARHSLDDICYCDELDGGRCIAIMHTSRVLGVIATIDLRRSLDDGLVVNLCFWTVASCLIASHTLLFGVGSQLQRRQRLPTRVQSPSVV